MKLRGKIALITGVGRALADVVAQEGECVCIGYHIERFVMTERPTLDLWRCGKMDEVATAVVFLCSRLASFITGAVLRIDGRSVAAV